MTPESTPTGATADSPAADSPAADSPAADSPAADSPAADSPAADGPGVAAARIDLQGVARQLGVHYMTAYRYVRLGRLPAVRENGRWWVDPADVARLRADPRPAAERSGGFAAARYRPRLRRCLLSGDEAAAWQLVERALASGASPRQVLLELIAPVMRDIGAECGRETLPVLEEHRATMVAIRVVCRLGPRFARRGRPRGTVIIAGVSGDSHVLPMVLLATVLRGEGYAVAELGADTPVESVAAAVSQSGPELVAVALSVSTTRRLPVARRTVRAVRRALGGDPARARILVGGPAVPNRAAADDLNADDWAADAGGVAALLRGEEVRR